MRKRRIRGECSGDGAIVSLHEDLSRGYLSVLTTWWLASPRASNPRDPGRSCHALCDLASRVIHSAIHPTVLVTQRAQTQCRQRSTGLGYWEVRILGE